MQLASMFVVMLNVLCFHGVMTLGFSARGWGEFPAIEPISDSLYAFTRNWGLIALIVASPPDTEHRSDLKTDLTALVRPSTIDRSEIYTEALSLLTSMQAAPSCNRVAASTLLSGCQSIDGSGPNAETSVEHARSIYAVQLAMCEIVSAGSAIPHQCKSLEPMKAKARNLGFSGSAKAKAPFSQSDVTSRQLCQCLQALESRPQWWTSYSNSRQNAVVMCKAAREDIKKGRYPAQ